LSTNASFIYYVSKDTKKKELESKQIKEILDISENKLNTKTEIAGIEYLKYFKLEDAKSFELSTVYPGLIIGSGYNYPAEENANDYHMGFYFDHTTGMPVIPGSTVKGILKSVFPKTDDLQEIKEEKILNANSLLKNCNFEITMENWDKLFEVGNVFYDAYVSSVPQNGKIFEKDYITPHNQEDSEIPNDIYAKFQEPKPLKFLKVAPSVTFTFQFKLKGSSINSGKFLEAEKVCNLFKSILVDFGIGAKRNVGYGTLVEV